MNNFLSPIDLQRLRVCGALMILLNVLSHYGLGKIIPGAFAINALLFGFGIVLYQSVAPPPCNFQTRLPLQHFTSQGICCF